MTRRLMISIEDRTGGGGRVSPFPLVAGSAGSLTESPIRRSQSWIARSGAMPRGLLFLTAAGRSRDALGLRVHQLRDCLDDLFERRQPQSPLIREANRSSGDLDVLESLLPPF